MFMVMLSLFQTIYWLLAWLLLQWEYFRACGEMIWWPLKELAQIVEKKYVYPSIC